MPEPADCPLCPEVCEDGHEWVDHLSDEHDVFGMLHRGELVVNE